MVEGTSDEAERGGRTLRDVAPLHDRRRISARQKDDPKHFTQGTPVSAQEE